jgi:hypothetical protein
MITLDTSLQQALSVINGVVEAPKVRADFSSSKTIETLTLIYVIGVSIDSPFLVDLDSIFS